MTTANDRREKAASPLRGAGRAAPWLNARGARTVLTFLILVGLFYALIHAPTRADQWFRPHLRMLAAVTSALLNLLGRQTTAEDTLIIAPDMSMEIVRGCDGIEPIAILVAALIASPAPALWTKLAGILVGSAILMAVNLIRLISLFCIGVYWSSWFDVMHEQIWQGLMIVFAIALWALWVDWAHRRRPEIALNPPPP